MKLNLDLLNLPRARNSEQLGLEIWPRTGRAEKKCGLDPLEIFHTILHLLDLFWGGSIFEQFLINVFG